MDVHQHERRLVLDGELDGLPAGRRLQQREPARLEDVPEELHVLLVVLDHEDPPAGHPYSRPAGSVNTNVLPWPTSLSTQIRPPCSSVSRLDTSRPSPVPSRCRAPT